MNILVVDDENVIRSGIKRTLQTHYPECRIYLAASADEAVVQLRSEPIDLVLSDIMMPGMSGLALMKLAKPQHPHVKWVFISAKSEFAYAQEALRLGARDYLLKLLVAFVITGVGGLVVKRLGFTLPKEIAPIAWATLVGGVIIIAIEWALRGGRSLRPDVTWAMAVAVGLGQLLAAVFPGTSRSAATIMIAMLLGLTRPVATEFSFLVGVPTLLAAGGLETLHALRHPAGPTTEWGLLALGTVVSAVTAFVVVRWLLRWVQTHDFVLFGWYRIALGLVMLARLV